MRSSQVAQNYKGQLEQLSGIHEIMEDQNPEESEDLVSLDGP